MPTDSRRASALVSAGILLSRLAGLVRETVVGHFLGRSLAANAFAYALRIPNILQNLLGEGVLSASFIPVHVRLLDAGEEDEARQLAGTVLGLLAVVSGGAAVLLVALAGPISRLLVLGGSAELQALVASLLRIVAPGLALLVLSAWCLGILNSHRQFFLSYVAPVAWNLAQIVAVASVGAVLLDGVPIATLSELQLNEVAPQLARALAWGTLAGGALQLAVQLPHVRRLNGGVRPRLSPVTPHVREVLRAFTPVVTGRGVVQLATFVDLMLASVLAGAALVTVQKALIFALLPVSLFGMSVAAAELPDLSTARRDDRVTLARRIDAGLGRIAFYVAPTAVGFVVVGELIVGMVYLTGQFGPDDVRIVAVVLAGASFGLLATTSSRLLQSVLYGSGNARGPARIAIVRVVLAALLGLVLMFQLDRLVLVGDGVAMMGDAQLPAFGPLPTLQRSDGLLHLGALGLTLASSIAALVEYALLRTLVDASVGTRVRVGGPQRVQIAAAAIAAAGAAMLVRPWLGELPVRVAGLAAVATVGVVHISVATALGVDEARALLASVRRVLRRGR
ncbi:MAG: putative peptidoglycan lipid II flippase [Nitriliruptoraceae bacterium]